MCNVSFCAQLLLLLLCRAVCTVIVIMSHCVHSKCYCYCYFVHRYLEMEMEFFSQPPRKAQSKSCKIRNIPHPTLEKVFTMHHALSVYQHPKHLQIFFDATFTFLKILLKLYHSQSNPSFIHFLNLNLKQS